MEKTTNNNFLTKKRLLLILIVFLLLAFICSYFLKSISNDPYVDFQHINPNTTLVQLKDEYYVYFYKIDCKYCKEVQENVLEYAENNDDIYFVNTEEYDVQSYNWTKFNTENDIEIGTVEDGEIINYYEGESEEKYTDNTNVNIYGKKIRYDIVIADEDYIKKNTNAKIGYAYASIQTPEIDYGSLSVKGGIPTIAGVPTLLKIKNKKVVDFYFDSVEIKPLLKKLNN